jgi:hypothetical protein
MIVQLFISNTNNCELRRDHKSNCSGIVIDGNPIPWSDHLTYLGILIKSSAKFIVCQKPSRVKFYQAFNSLFCKIPKANVYTIVSLVKTFCIPCAMYSLEGLTLTASQLSSLDNLIYNAFAKIFGTYNHDTLDWCMYYSNCLPLRYQYYCRKSRFLLKMLKIDNNVIKTCFNLCGDRELLDLKVKLPFVNFGQINDAAWTSFCNRVGIRVN